MSTRDPNPEPRPVPPDVPTGPGRERRRPRRTAWTMGRRVEFAGYFVGLAFALSLFTGTRGGLAYFSPHTLEYRSQSELTIFQGRVPIYRSAYHDGANELVAYIRDEGFVAPDGTNPPRWDVVFHWNDAWRGGYGDLYDILVRRRREIIDWSREDRARASLYWSEGFRRLRSDNRADIRAGRLILQTGWRCQTVEELRRMIAEIAGESAAR